MNHCFRTGDTSEVSLAAFAIEGGMSRTVVALPTLRKGRSRGDAIEQAMASSRRSRTPTMSH
eukprot:7151942-Alexandrium_andersonii.AAC.1